MGRAYNMADADPIRFKSLPVQMIQVENDVVLKRGCIEIQFTGVHNAARLRFLLDSFHNGSTQEALLAQVGEDQQSDIRELIEVLKARNILVPMNSASEQQAPSETPLDVFYWHFDPHGQSITQRLRSRRIVVLGVNAVSQSLLPALSLCGFEDLTLVAYPTCLDSNNRNCLCPSPSSHLFTIQSPIAYDSWIGKVDWKSLDCLIATSDCGGRDLLRDWNELAVQNGCHFFPIVLQDVIGYLGPLVIPAETACYECLIFRENSHLDDFRLRRAVERSAFTGDQTAFHPLMASVLGQVAAFELTKFYSNMVPIRHVSTLIEVNLLGTTITTRKILKIPRCVVCSSLHAHPSVSIHKDRPKS